MCTTRKYQIFGRHPITARLPDDWRDNPAVAAAALEQLRFAKEARTPARVWERPSDLATAILPEFVVTPALRLIEDALMDAYAKPNGRLIISIGPQEGKSTLATRFGSLWYLNHNPDKRIAIASYSGELATSAGRDIRNWIQTYDGKDDDLDLRLRLSPDSKAAGRWVLRRPRGEQPGGVFAVGVGGTLSGRAVDAMIIDDPFKDSEQANSEAYRDRVWDWWQSVVGPRMAGGPVVLIMTRWHEDDLAGRLLAAEDGHIWNVINIPAQADHNPELGQTDPLGRDVGEWLESARGRTAEDWEAKRISVGSRVWGALYQGRPSPDSGNVWKRTWWRRYDTLLWSVDETGAYRVECDEMIQSWDFTFKDTKGSDFVVGQVWARKGAEVFLLDQIRKRLAFTDSLTAMIAMTTKWPQAIAKLVEDKANGPAVISTLQTKIGGIIPIEPQGSKYARASAVSPFIEAGNVKLPSKEVTLFDVDELIDEAALFPNAAHDDMVDATSQALARMLLDGTGAAAWAAALAARAQQAVNTAAETAPAPLTDLDPLEQARQEAFRQQQRR